MTAMKPLPFPPGSQSTRFLAPEGTSFRLFCLPWCAHVCHMVCSCVPCLLPQRCALVGAVLHPTTVSIPCLICSVVCLGARARIVAAFVLGIHTGQGMRECRVRSVRLYCTDLPLAEALMALAAGILTRTVAGTESLRQ